MFKGMTILYAEDEDFIRYNVVEILQFMQINVISVSNGKDAYEEYLKNKPDVIIADIEMPQMDGLELTKKIRQIDNETPIIIATAYSDIKYTLKAIELNLTKYILKPIVLLELKEALTACVKNTKNLNSIKYFDEESFYDLNQKKLFVNNSEVKLVFHERNFLELLLKYSNQVVLYEHIESVIWPDGMSDAALRCLVRNLRQKLPEDTILNISKTGYKVVIEEK